MTIGEEIKMIRTGAGLTMEKFGEMLGVKKAYISQLENDGRGAMWGKRNSHEREPVAVESPG